MKKIVLSFLLFFSIQFCFAQSDDFYDIFLSDFRGNSAFIALEMVSSEYNGEVITENGHLYVLLNRAKGFDEKAYKSFMKDLLQNKRKLCLENASFKNIRVDEVKNLANVDEYAEKGKEEFINHFFTKVNEKLIMGLEKFSLDERNAVINKLFEWKIATFIEDESGYLVIMDN